MKKTDDKTGNIIVNVLMTIFTSSIYFGFGMILSGGDMKTSVICSLIGSVKASNHNDKTELQNEIFELRQKLEQK